MAKQVNERYFIKGYVAESVEYDFDKGEVGVLNSVWDLKDLPVAKNNDGFSSVREALDAILKANCFSLNNAWEDWISAGLEDEPGRFDVDILVDDTCEATEADIEAWKAKKKRLWNCHIVARLEARSVRQLMPDDI